MLKISEIDVYYGLVKILSNVSLHLDEGERVCILGKNGVGKTTLLRSIMGLIPPQAGTIFFDKERLSGLPPYKISQKRIAYTPQDNQLFPNLLVEENLFLAVRDKRVFGKQEERVLSYFPVLGEKLRDRARSLSGGQQKFLAIARALIVQPRIILLDEPSEGIQPNIAQELGTIITLIAEEEGCGILLVEQNRKLAHAVAPRGYVMDRGTIVAEGAMKEMEADGTICQYLTF